MAQEYGFEYDLVTYKWPSWLHKQSEKQRIIWAYKILFLDVLFPLSLKKVQWISFSLVKMFWIFIRDFFLALILYRILAVLLNFKLWLYFVVAPENRPRTKLEHTLSVTKQRVVLLWVVKKFVFFFGTISCLGYLCWCWSNSPHRHGGALWHGHKRATTCLHPFLWQQPWDGWIPLLEPGMGLKLFFSFLFLLNTRIGFAENFMKENGVLSTE